MEYENKRKEEIIRATQLWGHGDITRECLEYIFPELKESEDERIRKALIRYHQSTLNIDGVKGEEILAWLEKQSEQISSQTNERAWLYLVSDVLTWKDGIGQYLDDPRVQELAKKLCSEYAQKLYNSPLLSDSSNIGKNEQKYANNVEPKFHEGDWIIFNGLILYINEVVQGYYRTTSINGISNSYDWDIDNVARLWSIQDAKNGDVLAYVTDEEDLWIMIYRSLYEPYEGHVHYHALLVNDKFSDKGTCCICINGLKPATKEQRDLLFSKMQEAGYVWDAEKKELGRIEEQAPKTKWTEEGIREAQLDYWRSVGGKEWHGVPVQEAIAWLEKQGKPKLADSEDERIRNQIINFIEEYGNPIHCEWQKDWIAWLEKQGEQKSAWSEEDECYMSECISAIATKDEWSHEEKRETKHWLKSLKERMI